MIGIDVKGRFRVSVKREAKKECEKNALPISILVAHLFACVV